MRYLLLIIAVAAAAGVALVGAGTAAARATTETVRFEDTIVSSYVNPCTGEPGTLTRTVVLTFHHTERPSTSTHDSVQVLGDATFAPDDPSEPTLTGHYVTQFIINANSQTLVVPFSQTLRLAGNGSRLVFHEVGQLVIRPSGATLEFVRVQLTCG